MPVTINGTTGIAGVDGSAGTPAVQGSDTNTGVYFPAADTLSASTGGTERMRIDSSGNVGIGTTPSAFRLAVRPHVQITSPTYATLELLNDTGIQARFIADSANSPNTAIIGTLSNHDFKIATNGTERMRIDTSGNVGIGTASPAYKLSFGAPANGTKSIALYETGAGNAFYGIGNDTDRMTFYTGNTSGGAERLCITASGNVGIGTSSPSARFDVRDSTNTVAKIKTTGAGSYGALHISNSNTNGEASIGFRDDSDADAASWVIGKSVGATDAFGFYYNGTKMLIDTGGNVLVGYTSSNGAYKLQVNSQIFATSATIATSDGRYKENVTPLNGALDLVSALNPVQFSWKQHAVHNFDREQPTVGFIAQEVQQVLADKPYLNSIVKSNTCTIEPEEKDEEGNVTKAAVTEEFLGIAEGNMIAILTKAIQELKAEFDAYKAAHP